MTNFSFSTLFILLLSSLGHAEVQLSDRVNDCGDYLVSGVVRIKPEGMQIIVHEKTKSEQTISLKLGDQSAAAVYLDKPMTIGFSTLDIFKPPF